MRKFSFILLVFVFLCSCNKEESLVVAEKVQIEKQEELKGSSDVKIASFQSQRDLDEYLENLSNLSSDALDRHLEDLPYTTLSKYYESLYSDIDDLRSEVEYIEFVDKHKDYLKIVDEDTGEKVITESNATPSFVRLVLNQDRIIEIENEFYKYLGEYVGISTSYEELKNIKDVTELLNSNIEFEKRFTVISESSSRITEFDRKEWIKTNPQPGCKNDRRMVVTMKFYREDNSPNDQAYRDGIASNQRKGYTCFWYSYNTRTTWNNFNTSYWETGTNGNSVIKYWNESNLQCSNCYNLYRRVRIYNGAPNFMPSWEWAAIESDLNSRGLGGLWLNIDETY